MCQWKFRQAFSLVLESLAHPTLPAPNHMAPRGQGWVPLLQHTIPTRPGPRAQGHYRKYKRSWESWHRRKDRWGRYVQCVYKKSIILVQPIKFNALKNRDALTLATTYGITSVRWFSLKFKVFDYHSYVVNVSFKIKKRWIRYCIRLQPCSMAQDQLSRAQTCWKRLSCKLLAHSNFVSLFY